MKWFVGIIVAIAVGFASFGAGMSYSEKLHVNDRSFYLEKPKNLKKIDEPHPVGNNIRFHQHIIIFPTGETKLIEYYTQKDKNNKDIGMTEPYRRELTEEEMEHFRHLPILNFEGENKL